MAKETQREMKAAGNTAAKTETAVQTAAGPALREGPGIHPEPEYPVGELSANAGILFGTRPECVMAAMKNAGKSYCTVPEAKEIVAKFLKKEVK